ncbi:MAG: hypothetical protein H6704_10400 [Myxococcales bacterium]|nr:hypothetical protein [Myxococcales bacterium]
MPLEVEELGRVEPDAAVVDGLLAAHHPAQHLAVHLAGVPELLDDVALALGVTNSTQSPAAYTSGTCVRRLKSHSTPRPVGIFEPSSALRLGDTPAVKPTN